MKQSVEPTVVKPAKFAHFVLRVSDMAASIAWYGTVLDMKVVHRNDSLAFLTYDDEHHRLALVQLRDPVPRDPAAPGLDHVAYTFNSLEDLLATYKRLKGEDILPVWPVNHGLTISLYYADPDGNRVEFQVENFASKQALQDYMVSDAFASNPIGVEYDPEVLLRRFEAGEPVADLVRLGAL